VLCLNPAARLARRHRAMAGTVAMSATLHPLPYYRDVLGFAGLEPLEVECPSPFPASRRRVVVVPTVRTTYRQRHAELDAIAGAVARVSRVRPGHYAAYFPSFSFLDAVHARLPATPGPVLAQRPGMDGQARADLIARLRSDPGPLLVLAVLGGVLAEGIDLPGDALHGAIVVGPGLPQVGFERTEMRRYFEETAGHGFSYAMLYPGLQRVIQAAGRVHRAPSDAGVIVLLGRRFAQRPYRDALPAHWTPEIHADPTPVLDAFWRGVGATRGVRTIPSRRMQL
jgi:Rad3-related DNA helicase